MHIKDDSIDIEDFYRESTVSDDGSDLTIKQFVETLNTYEDSAESYSKIEWALYSCIKSYFATRKPFIKNLVESGMEKEPILVLGCGSGRDAYYIEKILLNLRKQKAVIEAIDYSISMIKVANKKVKNLYNKSSISFSVLDVRKLDNKFSRENYFGSIFCESALTHLSKHELSSVLKGIRYILKEDGIAFFGFRYKRNNIETDVYSTEGDFGKRHYLRLSDVEIKKLLFSNGFDIIWGPKIYSHPDQKRPPFINVMVKKVQF